MAHRYLIAIGCPSSPGYRPLARVGSDVQRITTFLTDPQQGYERVLEDQIPIGASSQIIRREVSDWFASEERCESDCVVIYWAGHGDIRGKANYHHLLTSGENARNLTEVAVKTSEVVDWIFDGDGDRPQNVLLLIDTCYAGKGTGQAAATLAQAKAAALQGPGSGLYIVASADGVTEASDGDFVTALLAAMQNDAWMPEGGTEYLSPLDLQIAINEWFAENKSPQRCETDVVGSRDRPPFLRNPRFAQCFDGIELGDRAHWETKGRAVDEITAPGWFFTGRKTALQELIAWLNADASDKKARVVTGLPGSGKSAVLGHLVIAANPTLRKALEPTEEGGGIAAPLPEVDSIDASIHARGATIGDVAASLAARLGLGDRTVLGVLDALRERPLPARIVLDALDEAENPGALERELLRPLIACPCVRLIIGTRTRRNAVPLAGMNQVIDLDAPKYFDPADIARYVAARLTRPAAHMPNAAAMAAVDAERIGQEIARRADRSFLYARIASRWLSQSTTPIDTSLSEWQRAFDSPADLFQVFGEDLDRFEPEVRKRVFDLLVPLAYARGKGLPQKNVWHTIASAISGREYVNGDIRLLKEVAGYYLVQDSEYGQAVYRLFHEEFANYLREQTRDEDAPRRFAEGLLSLVPLTQGGLRDWRAATDPYLRYHFPAHAADVGLLDQEMADGALLTVVPVDRLLAESSRLSTIAGRNAMSAYRQASRWFRGRPPDRMAVAYLRLAALRHRADKLAASLADFRGDLWWFPEWARWSAGDTGYVIGDTQRPIGCFSTAVSRLGVSLALCGGPDGALQLWNLESGEMRWEHRPTRLGGEGSMVHYPSRVGHIDLGVLDDRDVAAVAWDEGLVCLVDVEDGRELGWLDFAATLSTKRLQARITALALATIGQDLCLVTGSRHAGDRLAQESFEICTWALPDFQLLQRRQGATQARILCLVPSSYGGRPVLISGSDSFARGKHAEHHLVKVWGLDRLAPIWESAEGPDSSASDVRTCRIGNSVWILARSFTGEVTLFEPKRSVTLRVAGSHDDGLSSVIAFHADEEGARIVGVNNAEFRTFALREVADEEGVYLDVRRLSGHTEVQGSRWSGVLEIHGRPHVVSADAVLHLWDMGDLLRADEEQNLTAAEAQIPRGTTLLAVAANELYVAAGDREGRVWVWDEKGRLLWMRHVTIEHAHGQAAVRSLAFAETPGMAAIVVAASDGYLYLVDLLAGSPRYALSTGSEITALSIAQADRSPVAFVGVQLKRAGAKSHYVVRAYDLGSGSEIDTEIKDDLSPGYFEAMSEAPEGSRPWGLQASGYYKTKGLGCVEALSWSGSIWVALGGAHGEVRTIDATTFEEAGVWTMRESDGAYVSCLASDASGRHPLVYSGNDRGRVSAHVIGGGSEDMSVEGHRGAVNRMTVCHTEHGTCLISGGQDGVVAFWTPDLVPLARIETERSVNGIAHAGRNRLVLANDRGLSMIHLDSQGLFSSRLFYG